MRPTWFALPYAAVSAVHLVADAVGARLVADVSQVALMPALAPLLLAPLRRAAAVRARRSPGGWASIVRGAQDTAVRAAVQAAARARRTLQPQDAAIRATRLAAGRSATASRTPTVAPAPAWWPRVRNCALGALAFSWLGDTLPRFIPATAGFIALVAAFFIAQLWWIAALGRRWRASILGRRRAWLAAYLAAGAGVLALTLPAAGSLAPLLPVYAAALLGTGILATGWGAQGTVGGVLFMLSDSLIATFTFRHDLDPGNPWRALAIMSTYIAAQLLLVLAVRRHAAAGTRASSRPAPAQPSRPTRLPTDPTA